MLFDKEEVEQLKDKVEKQRKEIIELESHSKERAELKKVFLGIIETLFKAYIGGYGWWEGKIKIDNCEIYGDRGTYRLYRGKISGLCLLEIREYSIFEYKEEDLPEIVTIMQTMQIKIYEKIEKNKDVIESKKYKKDKEGAFYNSLYEISK